MTAVPRSSARVVLIDASDRVLLLKGVDPARPDTPIWHAPGGGIDPGELPEAAARRELAEEVGLTADELGPIVWTRHVQFSFDGTEYDQDEVYFVLRVDSHRVDNSGHTELERRYLTDHRWFSLDELRAVTELVAPPDFSERLAELIAVGPPVSPVEVAGAVLP
ncbi:MAG TPA: NUDIX domain-containing protein [Actinomycetes bacterium]|nr:NUDIX domain-containing protein [Actinomycetes bacterium]